MIYRCARCGASMDANALSCSDCRADPDGAGYLGPDPWDMAGHPERYDTEAARRRGRTRRRVG